jgi:hypothetical protein
VVSYLVAFSVGKASPILVRPLLGPHLRTWPWVEEAVEHVSDRRRRRRQDLAPVVHRALEVKRVLVRS